MLQKLMKINWVFVVLILLGLRSLIDANFPQAVIIACLIGLQSFREYIAYKTPVPLSEDVQRQLDEMKTAVAGLSMRQAAKPAQMEQQIRRFF